jgi:type VI secretion system protein ImpA
MADDLSAKEVAPRLPVDAWLQPLADKACGEDLEYDLQFLEFTQAAAGKPETQFAPAEAPAWPEVETLAAALFERTRDLRVAVPWCRARLHLGGLVELPESLRLLHGLLERFWEDLHPGLDPDDRDPMARITAMSSLSELEGLLGDARNVAVLADRRLGGLRARDIEVALDRLPPRADDPVVALSHVQGLLADHADAAGRVREAVGEAQDQLKALQQLMNDRFGIERSVDVKPLRGLLDAVASVMPASEAAESSSTDEASADDVPPQAAAAAEAPPAGSRQRRGAPLSIDSREDAVKAINLVCAYLERAEPTNPAQLLLRRAERLIDRNFLQLIKQLAPDAMSEVARVMGVDPDSVND